MKYTREEALEEILRRSTLLQEYQKKSKRNLLAGLLSGVAAGAALSLLCLRYRNKPHRKEGSRSDE